MPKINKAIVATVFVVFGCASPCERLTISPDKQAMQVELHRLIKVGQPLNEAETIMKRSGFTCEDLEFWLSRKCLKCSVEYRTLSRTIQSPFISDFVYVYLDHDGASVTRLSIEYESMGP